MRLHRDAFSGCIPGGEWLPLKKGEKNIALQGFDNFLHETK